MNDEKSLKSIRKKQIYNLVFPDRCQKLTIFGYQFSRVDNYEEKLPSLQHLGAMHSEFNIQPNTGVHAQTAFVDIPYREHEAILEWSGDNNFALMDILLLLSIFTARDVFALHKQNDLGDRNSPDVILADPRIYKWGGTLITSIPYKNQPIKDEPAGCNIGFEEGINQVYELVRSDGWQKKYNRGYFLFLVRMAFRSQPLESSYTQCWTIWEHLFAILNQQWLSDQQIHRLSSVEKISFILVEYALAGEIDKTSRKRIDALAKIRNRLVHVGKFPERGKVHNDAILFIRLTEFVIAKILGLSPNDIFNTIDKLEDFLNNTDK